MGTETNKSDEGRISNNEKEIEAGKFRTALPQVVKTLFFLKLKSNL